MTKVHEATTNAAADYSYLLERLCIEDTEQEDMDHWVAVEGGGFVSCAENDAWSVYNLNVVSHKDACGRKRIAKRPKQMLSTIVTRSSTRPRTRSTTIFLKF